MNNKILSMLIKGKLLHYDVPNEFKDDFEVIKAERIANTRSIDSHGYDVIKDRFFVTELIYYGKDKNGDDGKKSLLQKRGTRDTDKLYEDLRYLH